MKNIRIGVGLGDLDGAGGARGLDAAIARFRSAEDDGFQTAWVPNIFGMDAMTLIALAGRETARLELGTAVVPTYSRHPFYMAQQAMTTQLATGGRFVLGLGPSHRVVIESILGLSFDRVARHVEEHVRVVKSLTETGKVAHAGEVYRVNATLNVPATTPPPVLIGGLGPRMRRIAGALADGTITWMTGPRALGEVLVPEITKAASEAGRSSAPRIVCGLPVVVTNDAAAAREAAAKAFALYGQLPSYRAMLDLEKAGGPGDVLIAGDEIEVEQAITSLAAAGVTDLNAAIFAFGPDPQAAAGRTWRLLAELARR